MANQPKNPIILVKGDEKSPPVYRSDLTAWLHQGWRLKDEDRIETKAEREKLSQSLKPRTIVEKPTVQKRELELKQMQWRDIKDLAEANGIEKPEEGWEAAIPEILKKEGY